MSTPEGHTGTPSPQESQRGVAGATLTIGSFTLMSRILGFIRDILIASLLGTSNTADAFFVAFRIPNLFRRLLGEGALSAAFIPVFTQYHLKSSQEEAQEFLNSAFSFFFTILIVLLITGEAFTPWLVKITAPGFSRIPAKMALTVSLTRITFPYIFFIGLAVLTMALLNALQRFAIPAFSPVLLNLSMIAALLLAYKKPGAVFALAWGVMIGGILQFFLQAGTIYKMGWRLKPTLNLFHPGVLETVTLMLPSVLGLAVNQINTFVDTILASLLPAGSVSYLYYANRLVQFPLGLFGIALGTAILPTLSRHQTLEDRVSFKETFTFGLSLVLFITLPALMWLLIFATPTISTLFQRSAFTWRAAQATGQALFCYALGLGSFAMVKVVVPVFYAKKDMKTPVKVAVITLFLNILLNLILMIPLKHAGLALATSIASTFNLFLLLFILDKRGEGPHWGPLGKATVRNLPALLGLTAGSLLYSHFLPFHSQQATLGKGVWILGAIFQGGTLYLLGAWWTKSQELKVLREILFRKAGMKEG